MPSSIPTAIFSGHPLPDAQMKRIFESFLFFAALPLLAASDTAHVGKSSSMDANSAEALRIQRQIALAAELEAEGAESEALFVLAAADVLQGGAPATPMDETVLNTAGPAPHSGKSSEPRSIGAWLARGVVSFYRTFVGPAIGARCVLEPSCSRYFLEASRKHGILGLPMLADRLVREPDASAPDRPWAQTPSGQWRHPDPVADHDWWFR